MPYLQSPEEGIGFPRAGVRSELPHVGAEKQTLVIWRSTKPSEHLNCLGCFTLCDYTCRDPL